MRRAICKQCGAVNISDENSEDGKFISCDIPKDLDWFLPMQRTISEDGEIVYMDQRGKRMSREQYISEQNVDPEIAYDRMRHHVGIHLKD